MRWSGGIAVGVLLAVTAVAAVDPPAVLTRFQSEQPGVLFFWQGERLVRVYGLPFGAGASPEDTAAAFVQNHAAMFGVEPADLRPGNHFNEVFTQPLMYEPALGDYKFTLVYYAQSQDGVPVYGADLRLLVRNEASYPLVWAGSGLRPLGDFRVPAAAAAVDPGELGHAAAQALVPDLVNYTPSTYVVWAGIDDMTVSPELAVKFVADNGLAATGQYQRWLFLAGATTGEILHRENLVVEVDVIGSVKGMATDSIPAKADICNPENERPMPYARVSIGTTVAYADAAGNFTIPNPGTSQVVVTSTIAGKWFAVQNQGGANSTLTLNVTPPGPANFLHNAANTSEFNRAEVNGYVESNRVRDFVLVNHPTYPGVYNQSGPFTVNVNIADTCNAFYDGSSINFFRAGGGCANTAFSAVIHHEYGHHLVALGGSGQGEYGEGMADCMSLLLSDDSKLAYGFQNNCSEGIRDANNPIQYPCSGEIHYCGQLLSGCVWNTRNALKITNPGTYLEILSGLTVNSIELHQGTLIQPDITIDFLTLDDNDGNIYNGTPHYDEICAGFNSHNMDCPPLQLLSLNFPNGLPELIAPAGGTTVRVEVVGITAQPQPDTGQFYYRIGGGSWVSAPMQVVAPNIYDAVFPAVTCGGAVSYYFSAQTTTNQTVYSPNGAPAQAYSTTSGYALTVLFEDDFETNKGWTVTAGATTGNWERADPQPTSLPEYPVVQPGDDHSPTGTLCYVTQAAAGSSAGSYDVDGGPTHLTSPVFDLAGTDGLVSYWRWYHISTAWNDQLVVAVSNNNGGTWVTVETVASREEWTFREWRVSQYVTPTAQVRVRFTASDNPNDSLVEALIDDFKLKVVDCTPPSKKGDLNCDGLIDAFDIDPFVLALTDPTAYQQQYPNCNIMNGDINGDGVINAFDIDPFVVCVTTGNCP